MKSKMEVEEEGPEDRIRDEYTSKLNKRFGICISVALLGGSLFSLGTEELIRRTEMRPFKYSPIVQKYRDATKTLNLLEKVSKAVETKKCESDLLYQSLPYRSEGIKITLKEGFSKDIKTTALEKAIEIVKKDLEEISQNPEFRVYESGKPKNMGLPIGLTIGGLSSTIIGLSLAHNKRKEKKSQ